VNETRSIREVTDLLAKLDCAHIHYRLTQNRDDAITVAVTVPGRRIEIDMLADGAVEAEVFKSDGVIHGAKYIESTFWDFSD
jgi:hypothetical protein